MHYTPATNLNGCHFEIQIFASNTLLELMIFHTLIDPYRWSEQSVQAIRLCFSTCEIAIVVIVLCVDFIMSIFCEKNILFAFGAHNLMAINRLYSR